MLEGLDVSQHQGPAIDWRRVAAAGIAFSVARATYGTTPDPTFAAHFAGARDAGLVPGAYHFLRFNGQSGQQQAAAFLRALGTVKWWDADRMAVVLDLEDNARWDGRAVGPTTRAAYLQRVHDWLRIVEAALRRTVTIYTGPSFWTNQAGGGRDPGADLTPRPLWVAHYTERQPTVPAPWPFWSVWQYTGTGRISGVETDVDRNRCTPAALDAICEIWSA